jgi:Uma2 family endonuclease
LPEGEIPDYYAEVAPELVVEVRSPDDRWPSILAKVAEYLEAGVLIVVVLDYDSRTAHLFAADGTHRMLGADDELAIPELLGDFRVLVRTFFD